ncbi:hypothetical protein Q0N12_21150 [Rossellomorea marisflavi]|uniref:hypothetical protein n=2 Tax=Rossellomorea marisflavi TaxID=189381 RepID=UPI0034596D59
MDIQKLAPQTEKHRKLFDTNVIISPFGYEVNHVVYYVTIYKRKQKAKGYAVIGDDGYNEQDALVAFERSSCFSSFLEQFHHLENMKLKIPPESFQRVRNIIVNSMHPDEIREDNELEEGIKALEEQEELLKELQSRITEFGQYYDEHICNVHLITEHDIDRLFEVMSHTNIIQYLQGKSLLQHSQAIKRLYKYMKENDLDKELTVFDRDFIRELPKGMDALRKKMKEFEEEREMEHLPREEQVKIKKEQIKEIAKNIFPGTLQLLRYPKI